MLWRKWRAILSVVIQNELAFKANMYIWILTDVTTAIVMPLIWLASYNGRAQIHGFAPSQMVVYYLVMLTLTGFVEAHCMWDIAGDVKQGRFSIYLLRPFSFLSYMYACNVGWRAMRMFLSVPIFLLVALAFHRWLPALGTGRYNAGLLFWLSVVLGHWVSFVLAYCLGMLALWFYEVRSLYNFYYLPLLIFSGQIAPLAMLPPKLQTFVWWTPFPYTLAFPTGIILGKLHGEEILEGLAAQVLWIAVGLGIASLLWRGGLRRYTAFGI